MGNPKNKKPKESPQFAEICEPCKEYLDKDEEIPLPLLAKLVKFRLLDIKVKDQRRRETEKKVMLESIVIEWQDYLSFASCDGRHTTYSVVYFSIFRRQQRKINQKKVTREIAAKVQ